MEKPSISKQAMVRSKVLCHVAEVSTTYFIIFFTICGVLTLGEVPLAIPEVAIIDNY